jgi:hypothetical protein
VALFNNEFRLLVGNDYLGIAILDINLHILFETVLDRKGVLYNSIPNLDSGRLYQDGRLFTLHDQLYLGSHTT